MVAGQFFFPCVPGYHSARCCGNQHLAGFVASFLQSPGSGNIALSFHFPIAHRADQRDSLQGQVVADELIKAVSVFIRDKHVDQGNGEDEVIGFCQLIGKAIRHAEMICVVGNRFSAVSDGFR